MCFDVWRRREFYLSGSRNLIWAARYNPGDVLRYSHSSQETGIAKGEYARVTRVDAPNNRLTVERKSGEEVSYDPRRATP